MIRKKGAVMRAVITRPAEDATRSAAVLRAWGAEVLVEPLLVVMPAVAAKVSLDGVQAFLLTSANGARFLASSIRADPRLRRSSPFLLPAFCVGDQTMRTAREQGFQDSRSACGDVVSLAALVRRSLRGNQGVLLQAAGRAQAGDLATLLKADGFEIRRSILYETRPAVSFSDDFVTALRTYRLAAILFYSPRTATTFATLAKAANLQDTLGGIGAYCLSEAVADALASLPFAARRVSLQPTQTSLFERLQQDFPALAPPDAPSLASAMGGDVHSLPAVAESAPDSTETLP